MTSRQLKSLTSAFYSGDTAKVEQIFYEISHSLAVVNFDPFNSKYKQGLLVTIMNNVLPLLSHENLKMRLQAESFLGHWSSVISAFSPDSLLKAYQLFDTVSTLQPAAQAAIFNFFTNTICSIPPSERILFIGTCHCMLMSSKPVLLSKLAQDVWILLRTELTVSNISSIVNFLINSSIPKVVSFLCMKDPEELFPIVARDANLQFLKEFIPHWPDNIIIEVRLLRDRIVAAIESSNSNEISAAIEIVELIAERMFIPPLISQFETWRAILNAVEKLWASNVCTVSHKAAIIDLFSSLSKFDMVSLIDLQRFLVLDSELPTTIQVSIIKLSSFFVRKNKIPVGLIDFLKKQAIQRDPLLYVAVIQFLQNCFNEFFAVAPQQVTKILDLILHPLPRYFVEQLQILKLFNIIDWKVFTIDMLPMKLIDIVLGFLKEPYPSVVEKLSSFIQKMSIELPYAELNWFEDASYYFIIFHNLDPFFIIELLDANVIPSASYPDATNAIAEAPDLTPIATMIFSRILLILLDGIKALGYELDAQMKSLYALSTSQWSQYSDKMVQLLEIISENFQDSTFGKMIENSLKLIVLTVKDVKLKTNNIIGLINIARTFGCCYTRTTCRLLLELKEIEFGPEIKAAMVHYFDRSLPFSFSEEIAVTAVQTVEWDNLLRLQEYLELAADSNGEILIILDLLKNEDIKHHKSFLALKNNPEYVKECMEIFPFDEWLITEDDFDFISQLKGIKVQIEKIDQFHKSVIQTFPQSFIVGRISRKYSRAGDFTFRLNDTISLNKEFASMEIVQQETNIEIPSPNIPINPYFSKNPSRMDLFTFLWFSNRLTDKWEEIENYAIEVHNDCKFVSAFFSYARRHHLSVNINKWPSLITVHRGCHYSLISVALYFSFIRSTKYSELTDDQLELIERTVIAIGIENSTEFSLLQALKSESGLNKLVIESIVSIDLTRFGEIPFIAATEIEDILNVMKSEGNEMYQPDCFSILTQKILPELPHSAAEQFVFPPDVDIFSKYYNSQISIVEQSLVELDPNLTAKIVQFIEENRNCDIFIFYLLNAIKFTREQFLKLVQYIPESHPLYSLFLSPKLSLSEMTDYSNFTPDRSDRLINYLTNKPPSFSRQLMQILVKHEYGELSLSKNEIKKATKNMVPLFYELLPKGFDLVSEKMCNKQFPFVEESVLSLNGVNSESFKFVRKVAHNSTHSANYIIEKIYRLDSTNMCKLFGTLNDDLAKLELCDRIATILGTYPRYLFDTIYSMKIILKNLSPDQLMTTFTSSDFLNAPLHVHVFLCVKMIMKAIQQSNNENLKHNLDVVRAMIHNRVEDPKLLEIYECEDIIQSLSMISQYGV